MLFGELIKKKLESRNMSMRSLAKEVVCDVSYISKIVNTSYLPSIEVAYKIAKALDINPSTVKNYYQLDYVFDVENYLFSDVENEAITEINKELYRIKKGDSDLTMALLKILNKSAEFQRYWIINLSIPGITFCYQIPSRAKEIVNLYCNALNIQSYIIVSSILEGKANTQILYINDVIELLLYKTEDDKSYAYSQELLSLLK